jgi:serine/threonine-protein kinase
VGDVAEEIAKSQQLVGKVIADKFRLTACIGMGGSGAVFRADQIALGRTVAVKILSEDLAREPRLVKRFHDEALAASRLNHPNTVSIIDYGQSPDGLLYLAMEYVRGPTLTQLIAREAALPLGRALDIISQTLSGIEEAHLEGVVHADLKSDNLIVDQRRAGGDVVKILDFGIARLVHAPRGDDAAICGTPEYMAPEVIKGAQPGFQADLYAVGIILYELLARETPFFATSTVEVLRKQVRMDPRPLAQRLPTLPIVAEVDGFLRRALAKNPAERFESAAQMRAAVSALGERLASLDHSGKVKCSACGTSCAASFRFCPSCGHPRESVTRTLEVSQLAKVAEHLESPELLPWVGRSSESRQLKEHLRGKSLSAALLVVGGQGSGRSRLIREVCNAMSADPSLAIFQAGPDPSGLVSTYYPLRSLMASLLDLPAVCTVDDLGKKVLELDLVDADLYGLSQLFGHHSPLQELEPSVRRRETGTALLRVIHAVAKRQGIALIFEDVDDYDSPTMEVLRRLSETGTTVPVILVTEPISAEKWPADIARVLVPPLSDAEIGEIATALATRGIVLPEVDVKDCCQGSPAYLEHLIRCFMEGAQLEGPGTSLPDLVSTRISLLPQPTLELCQAVATFGAVELELVQRMGGVSSLEDALFDAVGRGILYDDGQQLTFTSRILRDVVYGSTPANVRRALHERAATVLETITSEPILLGHHHDLAGHAGLAVTLLAQAGDEAVSQQDDVAACNLYRRAIVSVRNSVRVEGEDTYSDQDFVLLSVKLSEALRIRGEIGLARGALSEARNWADTPLLEASLDRASATIAAVIDDTDGASQLLSRAIGKAIAAGEMNLVCDLYVDAANLLVRVGNLDQARRELTECIDLVTLGEGVDVAGGCGRLWNVLKRQAQIVGTFDPATALTLAEAALRQAGRVGNRPGAARVNALLAGFHEQLGNAGQAEAHRRAAIEEMRKLGDRRATAEILFTDVGVSPLGRRPGSGSFPARSRARSE